MLYDWLQLTTFDSHPSPSAGDQLITTFFTAWHRRQHCTSQPPLAFHLSPPPLAPIARSRSPSISATRAPLPLNGLFRIISAQAMQSSSCTSDQPPSYTEPTGAPPTYQSIPPSRNRSSNSRTISIISPPRKQTIRRCRWWRRVFRSRSI